MKRRFFTISIVVTVPLIVVSIIGSIGVFSSHNPVFEDYRMHEKQLGKLFERYEKENESMTDAELRAWENEVDLLSKQAAAALIEIQKDPAHWASYLASNGQPDSPSPFAAREYTGLAAKSLKEITSEDFDEWYQSRDRQRDDHRRAEMRAEGIWDDKTIEEVIVDINRRSANNPTIQSDREKMRQLLLKRESMARDRAVRAREDAEYQVKRDKDKALIAAEASRLATADWDISDTERVESQPPAAPEENRETSDNMRQSDADHILPSQPMSSADVPMQPKSRDTFNPDAVSDKLTQDLSRWEDDLVALYPELFRLKDAADQHVFEQSLPPDARRHFQQRKQRMQHEYVARLNAFISDTPTEQREHTLRIVRKTLEKRWNSDFAESVLEQLDFSDN